MSKPCRFKRRSYPPPTLPPEAMVGNTEILVQNLTYSHDRDPSTPASLSDINISLPKGSRTLLIGANGGVHPPS